MQAIFRGRAIRRKLQTKSYIQMNFTENFAATFPNDNSPKPQQQLADRTSSIAASDSPLQFYTPLDRSRFSGSNINNERSELPVSIKDGQCNNESLSRPTSTDVPETYNQEDVSTEHIGAPSVSMMTSGMDPISPADATSLATPMQRSGLRVITTMPSTTTSFQTPTSQQLYTGPNKDAAASPLMSNLSKSTEDVMFGSPATVEKFEQGKASPTKAPFGSYASPISDSSFEIIAGSSPLGLRGFSDLELKEGASALNSPNFRDFRTTDSNDESEKTEASNDPVPRHFMFGKQPLDDNPSNQATLLSSFGKSPTVVHTIESPDSIENLVLKRASGVKPIHQRRPSSASVSSKASHASLQN
jgi:hypothetical protein